MKETAYLLQAALIALWWVGLASSDRFFAVFQFDGVSATAFWSFLAPDILLIAGLSTCRAYRRNPTLEHIILGAFAYAALYCANAAYLTRSGWISVGLMFIGLAYNFFLCFHTSLFRSCASTNKAVNAAKTLVQVLCIWTLALLVLPYVVLDAFGELHWPGTGMRFRASGLFFLLSTSLGVSSAFFMVRDGGGTPLPLDQSQALVVSGPYRHVRNPMAVGGIGQGLSIALLFQSMPLAVLSLLGALVWHFVVRPVEEADMAKRFGAGYTAYRQQVSCWIPSLRGFRDPEA